MDKLSLGARLRSALIFTLLAGIGGAVGVSISEHFHGKTWAAIIASETSGYVMVRYAVIFVIGFVIAPIQHNRMQLEKIQE